MIYEVSSSQPNNLDNPQPDNLDENNANDILDSTSKILQEHEEEVPRKGAKYPMDNITEGDLSNNAKAFAFDVKNAFLYGELKEEVYIEAPPGFSEHFKPEEACRLKKSLYGLKQSPRAWFGRFTLAMKRHYICCWGGKSVHAPTTGCSHECSLKNYQAGDKGNRRSTSGYFSLVRGNLVIWRSKKQKVVSLSSAEAEFKGIAKGLAEALWIMKLVSEIGFPPQGST
nr:copia protein [Tanacetum cinerariifolium]